MKPTVYLLFLLLNSCVSRSTEMTVACTLSYSVPTSMLYTNIVSYKNDVYLSSGSYLKVYKMDSLGVYRDWTQNFYSLSFILTIDDTVFLEMNDDMIRNEKELLKKEIISKFDPVDSIEYETLEDEFEIKMHNTIPLVYNRIQQSKISLLPLKEEGGCYRLIYVYEPREFLLLHKERFKLPNRIGNFQLFEYSFASNELYLCF